jgi:putative oxidoreductase
MDIGFLVLRATVGALMAAHGGQKLFGWLGGYGIAGTGGFLESLGFRPGRFFATALGLVEFGGGSLIALGLLGPIGPAAVLSAMIVAALVVHRDNGLFAATNGVEVPLLFAGSALGLGLTGFGRLSLDYALRTSAWWTPEVNALLLAAGVLAAIVNLVIRRLPARVAA